MTRSRAWSHVGSGHPRRGASVLTAVAILLVVLSYGGGAGTDRANAQDSGGELVFNTPTPTDGGLVEIEEESEDDDDDGEGGGDEISFTAAAWEGGFLRNDSAYYGRPWTSVYGARSDYPAATLLLSLTDDPDEPIVLTFDGLDDEAGGNNPIAVEINGQRIYRGESWFASWDGVGNGENAEWTTVQITIPPELLIAGDNRITFRNLTDAANFSAPPYILLSTGTVTSPESGIFGGPDAIDVEIEVLGSSR